MKSFTAPVFLLFLVIYSDWHYQIQHRISSDFHLKLLKQLYLYREVVWKWKDVKAFADQRGNLLKVDFHKSRLSFYPFVVSENPLVFLSEQKLPILIRSQFISRVWSFWTIMTIVSFLQIVLLLTLESCPMERGLKVDQKTLQCSARHMVNLT